MTELVGECKKRGLLPFTNFNRLHVVPPCNVSDAEAKEGLAILDDVFTAIDHHYAGLVLADSRRRPRVPADPAGARTCDRRPSDRRSDASLGLGRREVSAHDRDA